MNKMELIESVAEDAGITKASASRAIEALCSGIERSLRKGQKVTMVGFGTFGISRRKARTGRNPQTGAPISIKAKKVVRFKAGKQLDRSINK
ncbi:MAG: DNA-binding protein [Acidobacteria bacterium]|nr:MAG: DNA-binding protein [Acidobacteriota bacterium]